MPAACRVLAYFVDMVSLDPPYSCAGCIYQGLHACQLLLNLACTPQHNIELGTSSTMVRHGQEEQGTDMWNTITNLVSVLRDVLAVHSNMCAWSA